MLYDSLPCNSTSQNDSSELNNLLYNYTSFDSSTYNTAGSAHAPGGSSTPPVYGPALWEKKSRGQTTGGDVDILTLDYDEDDGMEVSDVETDRLLSCVDADESEVTLSEVSELSHDSVKVKL